MIHGTPKQFLEALQTRREKGTSDGGDETTGGDNLTPQVTVHYAHEVLPPLVTRQRLSLDSISKSTL